MVGWSVEEVILMATRHISLQRRNHEAINNKKKQKKKKRKDEHKSEKTEQTENQ